MNSSPRATRRHGDGPVAAAVAASAVSVEVAGDRLVVRLPDPRLLLLVARSVLLVAALALLSVPSLRLALLPAPDGPAAAAPRSRWVDEPFELPMLLRDLGRRGLLPSDDDRRAIFLGDARSRRPLLTRLKFEPVSPEQQPAVRDCSVDFMLAADGFEDASFLFVERVLRVGGITVFRLSSDPSFSFHLPPNFRIAYIRRFRSTFVAIKKTACSNASGSPQSHPGRRLLSVPEAKKAALNSLEDVLLEPPHTELPDLTGDSLASHARPPRRANSKKWFAKQHRRSGSEFEVIWPTVAGRRRRKKTAARVHGILDWLRMNVRDEKHVVMKAAAEVVDEEMVKGKAIGLVEEHGKLSNEGG